METTLPYHNQAPRATRFNARILVFLAIICIPFVWFAYVFISQSLTGGISHANGLTVVDLKSLGNFPFDQSYGTTQDIPARWRDLDGKRVQLQGFMWDGRSAAGQLRQFQFVYNIAKCCFNGPPLVQERVFAFVEDGRTAQYTNDFARLTGVLHVAVQRNKEGTPVTVFTIDVESVDPV